MSIETHDEFGGVPREYTVDGLLQWLDGKSGAYDFSDISSCLMAEYAESVIKCGGRQALAIFSSEWNAHHGTKYSVVEPPMWRIAGGADRYNAANNHEMWTFEKAFARAMNEKMECADVHTVPTRCDRFGPSVSFEPFYTLNIELVESGAYDQDANVSAVVTKVPAGVVPVMETKPTKGAGYSDWGFNHLNKKTMEMA